MGIICSDESSPREVTASYSFKRNHDSQWARNPSQEYNKPPEKVSTVESVQDLKEEEKDVFNDPIGIAIKQQRRDSNEEPRSYTTSNSSRPHPWNTLEPQRRLQISYSSKSVQEQSILVDEKLMNALSLPQQKSTTPLALKLSLSRNSNSHVPKKKVRFNETVTIHRITYSDARSSRANPEMCKLVVFLREVWTKLDLDEDDFLNLSELKRFCNEVWEEPVGEAGAKKIMSVYAETDPEKGMDFNEWCILIKDEDPDLQGFIEELYEIFVNPNNSKINTDSEIEP